MFDHLRHFEILTSCTGSPISHHLLPTFTIYHLSASSVVSDSHMSHADSATWSAQLAGGDASHQRSISSSRSLHNPSTESCACQDFSDVRLLSGSTVSVTLGHCENTTASVLGHCVLFSCPCPRAKTHSPVVLPHSGCVIFQSTSKPPLVPGLFGARLGPSYMSRPNTLVFVFVFTEHERRRRGFTFKQPLHRQARHQCHFVCRLLYHSATQPLW